MRSVLAHFARQMPRLAVVVDVLRQTHGLALDVVAKSLKVSLPLPPGICREEGLQLGLVIDLTNTDRYYKPQVLRAGNTHTRTQTHIDTCVEMHLRASGSSSTRSGRRGCSWTLLIESSVKEGLKRLVLGWCTRPELQRLSYALTISLSAVHMSGVPCSRRRALQDQV